MPSLKHHILVLQHVPHEGLGTLAPLLAARGIGTTTFNLIDHPQISPAYKTYDGLIVLGGPMSANDSQPGILKEIKIVEHFIKCNKPTLGICLGSQLIAKALGAKVKKNPRKEIGWYPLELTSPGKKSDYFKKFNATETVFQWHGETFDLPRDAVHLGKSPLCAHQAFSYKNNVIALQFHLEVTPKIINEWLNEKNNAQEIASIKPNIDPTSIQNQTPHFAGRLKQLSDGLFTPYMNFLSLKNRNQIT